MSTATAPEILMPKLSDSMEEGTILSWLVAAGATVTGGDDLLEVETDKANMTVQAEGSGALEILVEEGETVAVGTPIGRLGDGANAAPPAEPRPPREESTPPLDESTQPTSTQARPSEPSPVPGRRRRSTPLARRLAREYGIALDSIAAGSGAGGRIVKADVLAAAGIEIQASAESTPAAAPAPAPVTPRAGAGATAAATVEGAKGGSRAVELSRLQIVIARRMAKAKATVPHFQVETEVRMDAAVDLRAQLKAIADREPAASLNDMIVRAAALALRAHPRANGSYKDGAFELHDRVNVGIAVAAADALVVPTVFDADRKSLGGIGRESRRLAERVRAGEVTPPELAGGTFTVSNLGMFGMTAIYPVINPPQAAILGVGKTRDVLLRGEGSEIVDAALLTLTLSCDHRILYGAEAAEFLATIRDLLESPLSLWS